MNFLKFVLYILIIATLGLSAENNCKENNGNLKNVVKGFIDNDTTIDILRYDRKPEDPETIDIVICTKNNYFKLSYSLSETNINISNPEKGVIEISEGSFTGTAPLYYYYYTYNDKVDNWLLTKTLSYQQNITIDGVISPTIQISYKDGIKRIDDVVIPSGDASIEPQPARTQRFTKKIDSLYTLIYTAYKNKQLATFDDTKISVYLVAEILKNVPISNKNLNQMNDVAYFLSLTKNGLISAAYILEILIDKFPDRVVAYINLGDTYFGLQNTAKAKEAYLKYIDLMKKEGKESKIPNRVFERVK
jgi:hypothetical protein